MSKKAPAYAKRDKVWTHEFIDIEIDDDACEDCGVEDPTVDPCCNPRLDPRTGDCLNCGHTLLALADIGNR
jgi:hypothetical protein